jgi:hypothetical protein
VFEVFIAVGMIWLLIDVAAVHPIAARLHPNRTSLSTTFNRTAHHAA